MDSFSSYTNRVELGRGGMSTVYRATALDGTTVALKVLAIHLAADKTALTRFQNEIRLLTGLIHPNIVRLLGADLRGNPPFIVMEYVEGDTLDKLVARSGFIAPRRLAQILLDVGYALDFAHSKGVIHRDVKPSNILIRKSNERALLTDFGVAKSNEVTAFTATHARVGSVYYMSPEQVEGRLEITRASDIYSLGVTAYLALTGKHPFEGTNEIAIAKKHIDTMPVHVSDLNPTVPRVLGNVVMKALEKLTYKRHETAGDFARRFRDALTAAEAATPSAAAAMAAVAGSAPVPIATARNESAPAQPRQSAAQTTQPSAQKPAPKSAAIVAVAPAPAPQKRAGSSWALFTLAAFAVVCCAIGVVGLALLNSISDPFPISWPSTARATAAAGVLPLDTVTPLPHVATAQVESIADDLLRSAATSLPTETPFGYLPTLPPTVQMVQPIVVPNGNPVITATPYVLPPPYQPGPHDVRPSSTPPPRPLPPALPANPWPLPPLPSDTPPPAASATPIPPVPTPLTSPLLIITSAP
jgi:serine/threonine protein kinase